MKRVFLIFGTLLFSANCHADITSMTGGSSGGLTTIDGTVIIPASGTSNGNWTVRGETILSTTTIDVRYDQNIGFPLTIDRGNTEGRWIRLLGSGNDYGGIFLRSGGVKFSSGANSDTWFFVSPYTVFGGEEIVGNFSFRGPAGPGTRPFITISTGNSGNRVDLYQFLSTSAIFGLPIYLTGFGDSCVLGTDANGQIVCEAAAAGGIGGGSAQEWLVKGQFRSSPTISGQFDPNVFKIGIPAVSSAVVHLLDSTTYWIRPSTVAQNGVFFVSSATIQRLNALTVAATNFETVGLTAGFWGSNTGELQLDPNGDNTVDAKINVASATFKDFAFGTTDYLMGRICQTFTGSMTAITAFSTMALYGLPIHLQTDTTGVFEMREFYPATGTIAGIDPVLSFLMAESTGLHPNNMYINLAISTYTDRSVTGSDVNSMVWNSTVAVALSSAVATVATMQKGGFQNTVLTNWKNQIAGAAQSSKPFFVKIWFWATNSQSTKVLRDLKIAVKRQT